MVQGWYRRNKDRLTNPISIGLITVGVTAIVSVILVPYITNIWQVYQKELEIKFDIAEDINDAVSSTIWSPERLAYLQFNETDRTDNPVKSIPEGLLVVEEKCLPIQQRLLI